MQIEILTPLHGKNGNDKTYFHPRISFTSDEKLIMTLQQISGSDYFHPVNYCFSKDGGRTWSELQFIPDLGRKPVAPGIEEGVCDVWPDYHPQTESVITLGHNVYYKNGKLFDSLGDFNIEKNSPVLRRFPVYNIMDKNGKWLMERKKLDCPELADCSIYSCGSSQKIIMPDGNILIPLTFGYFGREDRMVTSILCSFDGQEIKFIKKGSVLELKKKRGLLEPSMTLFNNRFYITIRAEDDHAYFSVSDDGLNWGPLSVWKWENGSEFITSTTQQHWMQHKGKLYLVYTRKTNTNTNIMRWRAPLFAAEFDTEKKCLKRDSETVIFPMIGDGLKAPQNVPLMGNFGILKISEELSIISDGSVVPFLGYKGTTLIGFVK